MATNPKLNLKKCDLIDKVAEQTGCTRPLVREVLAAAANEAQLAISSGSEVMLFGLGKLRVSSRPPRAARNPHTGEPVTVPARNAILFKASTALLKAANDAKA